MFLHRTLLACSLLGTLFVCRSSSTEISPRIFDIFTDFSFVGSAPADLTQGPIDGPPPGIHGSAEQRRPRRLDTGVRYIFHHRAPVENESLGLRELPDRLISRGFRVMKAPESAGSMMQLIYGGPLFRIEFSDGNHTGVIFNSVHTGVGDGWTDHDYVLVYMR